MKIFDACTHLMKSRDAYGKFICILETIMYEAVGVVQFVYNGCVPDGFMNIINMMIQSLSEFEWIVYDSSELMS